MYYTQVLRVRNGLMWLAGILAGLLTLFITIAASNGVLGAAHRAGPGDDIPLTAIFVVAGFVSAWFGSRFARSLSEENEAHLPVAWTKPVSRTSYALATFGVDVVGILCAFALVVLAGFVMAAAFGVTGYFVALPDTGAQLVRFLAFPLACYGLLAAMTASAGKNGGGIVGAAWVGAIVLTILAGVGLPPPWGAIFGTAQLFNPIAYAGWSHSSAHDTVSVMQMPHPGALASVAVGTDIVALLFLFAAGLAAAVWLWRRVEA